MTPLEQIKEMLENLIDFDKAMAETKKEYGRLTDREASLLSYGRAKLLSDIQAIIPSIIQEVVEEVERPIINYLMERKAILEPSHAYNNDWVIKSRLNNGRETGELDAAIEAQTDSGARLNEINMILASLKEESKCEGNCPNTCKVHRGEYRYCTNDGCLCHKKEESK